MIASGNNIHAVMEIALFEWPYYCCIHMQTFRSVQFRCYVVLMANCVSEMTKMLRLYKFTIPGRLSMIG